VDRVYNASRRPEGSSAFGPSCREPIDKFRAGYFEPACAARPGACLIGGYTFLDAGDGPLGVFGDKGVAASGNLLQGREIRCFADIA